MKCPNDNSELTKVQGEYSMPDFYGCDTCGVTFDLDGAPHPTPQRNDGYIECDVCEVGFDPGYVHHGKCAECRITELEGIIRDVWTVWVDVVSHVANDILPTIFFQRLKSAGNFPTNLTRQVQNEVPRMRRGIV